MDRLRETMNQKLAAPSSRRSFLTRLGKMALVGGALAAGLGPGTVLASSCCPNNGGGCIPPDPYTPCSSGSSVCCRVGSSWYSYTSCTGCGVGGFCCVGSTNCFGPTSNCGFAPVHRA